MAANQLKSLALIGASGNVGASTLKNLLQINNDIKITILSRADSKSTFPESSQVTVKKGSYSDESFLHSAFEAMDAVMLSLSFMSGPDAQINLINAAAKAGVKWIIPNEYAGDGFNKEMCAGIPYFGDKVAARKHIDELANIYQGLKWIGVSTSPWTEMSINTGMFGFNVLERKATLYTGSGPFNSSSANRVGLGIAKLLTLPITNPSNPRASLEHYANNFVYISSFSITQDKLFRSIQKETGTLESDWTIERPSISGWIADAKEKLANGDYSAGAGLAYAHYMGEGLGGDVEAKSKEDRAVLGLEEENLDEVVRGALSGSRWL